MPELPEVEVVRAGLDPAVRGATITGVDVRDARAVTRHLAGAADFERRLTGRRVAGTARRGKFLWLLLDEPSTPAVPAPPCPVREALMVHLGMSGQLLVRRPDAPPERHERIRMAVDNPLHGELAVVFADQRTFGSLALAPLLETPDGAPGGSGDLSPLVPDQAAHIARDPLDEAFDDAAFRRAVARKASAIKRVLLDQGTVSGIGNIYADEALWAARIHPETEARALPTRAVNRLLAEIRGVLLKALAEGGTSFDAQYVNVNGQSGYFAHSLNAYGRDGEPCPRCGRALVRVSFTNRSSHFCPRCQRKR